MGGEVLIPRLSKAEAIATWTSTQKQKPPENCSIINITMHPIACLVIALAAAVSAAPAPNDNTVANSLETRQTCLFDCLCDSPDDEPVASTGTCCASVGGLLSNGVCCPRSLGVVLFLHTSTNGSRSSVAKTSCRGRLLPTGPAAPIKSTSGEAPASARTDVVRFKLGVAWKKSLASLF